jgi:dipeptidyl-peptidase-4
MFNKDLNPTVETFKYPKGREEFSSFITYDVASKATKEINLGKYNDFYIARMEWTNDANVYQRRC